MQDQVQANLTAAKSFVRAVEAADGSFLDGFFASDVQQIEWPNRFKPDGDRRDLAKLKADLEAAKGVISAQSYEITSEIATDTQVVLEMIWRGTMAIEIAPLKAGQELLAHCVAVFDFAEGKVVGLRNYDCFDAF